MIPLQITPRLKMIPDRFKTQEMCNEAVHIEPLSLEYVPDRFKTQRMCSETGVRNPYMLRFMSEDE